MVRLQRKKEKIMDFNVNVHVKIEGLDQLLSALTPVAALISGAKASAALSESAVPAAAEDKPRRGRPRKAKAEEPQSEEPKAEVLQPEAPEPKAPGPKAPEPKAPEPKAPEPEAPEPKAEEPQPEAPKAVSEEDAKKMLGELRTACVKLSKAADANRVLAVIQSFGYKSLTSVPVEKYGELLELINAEIEVAEGK